MLLYKANDLVCRQLVIDTCRTLLIFVDSQGQGKTRSFAGQVQHWAFVAFQLAID